MKNESAIMQPVVRKTTRLTRRAVRHTIIGPAEIPFHRLHGGRSSMVELQFVVLAVAGSSPVGRPPLTSEKVWLGFDVG